MYTHNSKSSYHSSAPSVDDDERHRCIFELELDDASMINKILLEVSDPDENSTLVITDHGLRLVATSDKTSQQSAFFNKGAFKKFAFHGPDFKFRFLLKDFIHCLGLLQDDGKEEDSYPLKTSLTMRYNKKGDPLRLRLGNSSNCTVECELKEYSILAPYFLMGFDSHEDTTDIEFWSKELYKFISGLDMTSIFVKLVLEPGDVPVRFITESTDRGEVELEIREDDNPAIIKSISNVTENVICEFSYRTTFIKPALEALRTSKHMRMKCGSTRGLLLMEHFHGQEPRLQSVEYFIFSEAK